MGHAQQCKACSLWMETDAIPIGVVIVQIRASSPSQVELGPPSTQLLCLDNESLKVLEKHEESDLIPSLRALVEKSAAKVAVEQDVLALWAAGMYEGALHVRVMAIQATTLARPLLSNSPRKEIHSSETAHQWSRILPYIYTEPAMWYGISRDLDSVAQGRAFWETDLLHWSLAEMYRKLPSPPPLPRNMDVDLLNPPQLRCTLFSYQKKSLAKILQRELWPQTYCDPYFIQCMSPCMIDGHVQTYAMDPERLEFFPIHAASLYPDVRGGILCDEMGVGKTIICLALVLSTIDQMSQPEQESMVSSVTSNMAMEFPEDEYHGKDPAGYIFSRVVTAPFGAPSPGERLGRRPKTHVPPPQVLSKNDAATTTPVPGSVSLAKIAVHRLRTTHACRPDLLDELPAQLQHLLGKASAPFILLWPPPPVRMSRVSHERTPVRVYLTHATLVVVPPTLVMQWLDEINKHCIPGALRVLCMADMHAKLPSAEQLAQDYDLILMSHVRFGKEAGDEQRMRLHLDSSPLMQVYWKRLIIDEGNMLAGDSLLVRLCACLRVERRWVVTGTPTQALVGASALQVTGTNARAAMTKPHQSQSGSWTLSERKNLDRLKQLLVRFLRLAPIGGVPASMISGAKTSGPPSAKERDWNMLIMTGMNHVGEWPAKRRLYNILSRIMVRNRVEDVEKDCPLPPLERRTVLLAMTTTECLTYNALQSLIMLNAALSQKQDRDYFFHASNRKALASVMENLALACFHFAGQGFLAQVQHARDHVQEQLAKPDGIAESFRRQAIEAMHQLDKALHNDAWTKHICQNDVLYHAEHATSDALLYSWSKCGSQFLTSEELLNLRETCRKEVSHVLDADDLCEELMKRGVQYLRRQSGRTTPMTAHHRMPKPKSVPKREDSLRETYSQPSIVLPDGFDDVRVHTSTSTKLNMMLSEIIDAVQDEKVLVFSTLDNVLYELANALELLRIPFLFYVSGMPQHLRNAYANMFMHKSNIRCLLMTTSVGGRGLDLHCASRVIFAEPVWHWDLESQAVKRAWRMGQTRRVLVSTYVMRHTFEERITERKQTCFFDSDGSASEHMRPLTDDPGMREFIANPQLVHASEDLHRSSWTLQLFGTPSSDDFCLTSHHNSVLLSDLPLSKRARHS